MSRFILGRLSRVVAVVAGLIVVTFFMTRALTDPVKIMLGASATRESKARLEHSLGLDQPILNQFFRYLGHLLRGDLGQSIWLNQPVREVIVERLGASLLLATLGILLAILIGLPLGILGGLYPGRLVDRVTTGLSALTLAIPDFWLGLVFIIIFSVHFGWFPTGGYEGLAEPQYFVLPALAVAMLPSGRLARVAREAVIEEMGKQYVVAARSRGMTTAQVVRLHVFKNIAVTAGTLAGYDFLLMFTGYVATIEVVFNWPGLGRLAVDATLQQDVFLLSGLVVATGLIIGIGNMLIDTVIAAVDRRRAS